MDANVSSATSSFFGFDWSRGQGNRESKVAEGGVTVRASRVINECKVAGILLGQGRCAADSKG